MKKRRQSKLIMIIALVVVIAGMSIGFAVFSNTLLISSTANVKPDESSFGVNLYASPSSSDTATTVTGTTTTSASVGTATINSERDTITGVTAGFTKPGQSVTYTLYAHNVGEYIAYLKSINFATVSGATTSKVCTAESNETTASLVAAACEDITLTVSVGSTSTSDTISSITGHSLNKDAYEVVNVTITYDTNGDRADGKFNVSFGDVTLDYSSVDTGA